MAVLITYTRKSRKLGHGKGQMQQPYVILKMYSEDYIAFSCSIHRRFRCVVRNSSSFI